MMTYTFTFNSSACSGCKACLEACRDKNGLPRGVLWRRVIEVSSGEWHASGDAWENTVFAYYVSLACNHCTHPKCAGVCPTDAFSVRPDGIVLLDSSKCMGCGYCSWACPYGAPQYDRLQGVMTKCDFCYDSLDTGSPPTCVAACPLRVLDYAHMETPESLQAGQNLWQLPASQHPFPLPNYSRTEPHLVVRPHPAMKSLGEKVISNLEEIFPSLASKNEGRVTAGGELPLVAFTLLIQMAVGMAVLRAVLFPFPLQLSLSIGLLLATGGLVSFLHLGRKRNAWRSVGHLKKSWLSREILAAGSFGTAWAVTLGLELSLGMRLVPWLVAVAGIVLVYCMSRVYLLRAVPGWNTWRTPAAFFISTLLLGALGVRLVLPLPGLAWLAALAMLLEIPVALASRPAAGTVVVRLRIVLLVSGILGMLLTVIFPQGAGTWLAYPVFSAILAAEAIGRWQFYSQRIPYPLRSG